MWSFLGIALSSVLTLVSLLTRRAAMDVGRRQERSESYGFIRWAAEIALSDAPGRREAGVEILTAITHSGMVDTSDEPISAAVLSAVSRADQEDREKEEPWES
jgi:hypothetical protein